MSWNGTVTCGYCCGEGHNKRTCPRYTKDLEARLADERVTGYAREHYQEELDKRGRGKAGAHRTCSFCDNKGHDRRTCQALSKVVSNITVTIIEARKDFIKNAEDAGFGVGSLVKFKRRAWSHGTWTDIPTVCIVEEIHWADITYLTLKGDGKPVSVTYYDALLKKKRYELCRLPFQFLDKNENEIIPEEHYLKQTELIGPGRGPVTVPNYFLSVKEIKKIAKKWTKGAKAYQYGV